MLAYLRVSTDDQADSGLGLEAQRAQIEAYASLYGLTIDAWIVDAGESGKDMRRPGMARVLAQLDGRKTDGVVVAKLDRLTRSVRDAGTLCDRYFATGRARLVSVGEQIDTTSAAGRLVLNVLTSVAQWEREAIAERTSAALRAKRRRGEATGGTPRYGEAHASGRVHTDANEVAALDRIATLRAEGMSVRSIAARLDAEHVPCRGKAWRPGTVHAIVRRLAA